MKYYTNDQIGEVLDVSTAMEAVRAAYVELHDNEAAVQVRSRIALPHAKFSTMGAMLSSAGVAAVKMYTTLNGQFRFFIALLSLDDGAMLAMMEADSLTRMRTCATTALAARYLARPSSKRLGIFGSGVQATAHAEALAQNFDFSEAFIRSNDDRTADALAQLLHNRYNLTATQTSAQEAASADIVVLATRASEPVIHGSWLRPGAFVAGIGATRPDQREIDDATIEAASEIVVDWLQQTPFETGDLMLAPRDLLARKTMTDLSSVIAANEMRRDDSSDVILYKAVGMALQDAAIAHLAYTQLINR